MAKVPKEWVLETFTEKQIQDYMKTWKLSRDRTIEKLRGLVTDQEI
jgi:hypothetical protein